MGVERTPGSIRVLIYHILMYRTTGESVLLPWILVNLVGCFYPFLHSSDWHFTRRTWRFLQILRWEHLIGWSNCSLLSEYFSPLEKRSKTRSKLRAVLKTWSYMQTYVLSGLEQCKPLMRLEISLSFVMCPTVFICTTSAFWKIYIINTSSGECAL